MNWGEGLVPNGLDDSVWVAVEILDLTRMRLETVSIVTCPLGLDLEAMTASAAAELREIPALQWHRGYSPGFTVAPNFTIRRTPSRVGNVAL
jgi:hypothetical protein